MKIKFRIEKYPKKEFEHKEFFELLFKKICDTPINYPIVPVKGMFFELSSFTRQFKLTEEESDSLFDLSFEVDSVTLYQNYVRVSLDFDDHHFI